MAEPKYEGKQAFLLLEGGPLYRLQKAVGLVRETSPLIVRRAVLSILITWFPLFVLAALQHLAFRHVPVPFIRDIGAHARFLLAIPLLLLGEVITGPRLAHAASFFVRADLVLEKDYPTFDHAVERGLVLRNSVVVEALLALLAYTSSLIAFRKVSVRASTWYLLHDAGISKLTWAGWWYLLFCLPFFNFLVFRWLWRMGLWAWFLRQMNTLDLQLFPTHPDQAGGLGFLGETQRFFGIVFLAYSIAISGITANSLLYDHMPLSSYYVSLGIFIVFAVLLNLGPLLIFLPRLIKERREGIFKYGALATAYTGGFQKKWIEGKPETPEEPLLGTGDIQSLADLGNSYELIERMNVVPFNPRAALQIAIVCLIPMLPLLLTVMPLKEILKLLLKVLA